MASACLDRMQFTSHPLVGCGSARLPPCPAFSICCQCRSFQNCSLSMMRCSSCRFPAWYRLRISAARRTSSVPIFGLWGSCFCSIDRPPFSSFCIPPSFPGKIYALLPYTGQQSAFFKNIFFFNWPAPGSDPESAARRPGPSAGYGPGPFRISGPPPERCPAPP